MMVVQEGEKNSSDQRHIEYRLWERHHVSLIRRSLQELGKRATFDEKRNLTMYVSRNSLFILNILILS